MLMEWAGVTKEIYEEVRKEAWEGNALPEGAVVQFSIFFLTLSHTISDIL